MLRLLIFRSFRVIILKQIKCVKMKKTLFLYLIIIFLCAPSPARAANVAENPVVLKEKGMLFYSKHDYKKALDYFVSIPYEKRDESTFILISNSYESIRSNSHAHSTLIGMIKKYPQSYSAYYNMGVLDLRNNELEAALECFKKAIDCNKKFAPAYYNLALTYFNLANYNEAYKEFKTALKLSPKNADIYYNLAITSKKMGNKKKYQNYMSIYNNFSEN